MDRRRSGAIINETVTSYIEGFYKNKNPELENLRAFAESKGVPVILRDTEWLLSMIIKMRQPERILEIGTAIGYSACCFADICTCEVTTLESDPEMYEAALSNISNMEFDGRVKVLYGRAENIIPKLPRENLYDLVFIDAAKSHYKEYWDACIPLCREDSMIICDNILMKGSTASDEYDTNHRHKTSIKRMREFIKFITNIEYADTTLLSVGDGVSVSIINKEQYEKA